MGINYQGRGIEETGRITVFVQETPIYDESVYPPVLIGVSRSLATGTDTSGSAPITFTGTFSGDASQLTIAGASISGSLDAITQTKAGYVSGKDFSGPPYTAAIAFTAAASSSLYGVSIVSSENRAWTIQSQTTGGFTINTNSSVAINSNVYWSVAPLTQ